MENVRYISHDIMSEKTLMAFEICGELYQLSEYEFAINENETELHDFITLLQEFPYSVRNLKNEYGLKQLPVFIIYNDEKLSLYDFFKKNHDFEKEIPNVEEINCLEVKHELTVKLTGFQNKDEFYIVIINTFRVFQDLYNLFSSARFALLEAQRILHLKSSVIWKDGHEQLWYRTMWLNNAVVFYNSCFDRLMQTIWIGFELFVGIENKKGKKLSRQDLKSIDGLEDIYSYFDFNKRKNLFPDGLKDIIEPIYSKKLNVVRQYANSIKHRGGLRYKNSFPFGQICDIWDGGKYSSFETRNEIDIDEVIGAVKEYHIAFRELILEVLQFVMDNFKRHGYFSDEPL